ncbi:MAG: hypothetical protein IPK82_29180 [Polyangiaceae bacterium]|nr:hypothetical protein [Polyangiaceae bacterium]
MKKSDLLELLKHAHLTVGELRSEVQSLTPAVADVLTRSVRRKSLARLPAASEKVKNLIQKMPVSLEGDLKGTSLRDLTIKAVRDGVQKDNSLRSDDAVKVEVERLSKAASKRGAPAAGSNSSLAEALGEDLPIAFHPDFQTELESARIYRLADTVKLSDRVTQTLVRDAGSLAQITGSQLDNWVAQKKVSAAEAEEVGRALSIYHLVDGQPELVERIVGAVQAPSEVVTWTADVWVELIQQSKVPLPEGQTVQHYAQFLRKKAVRLFPSAALSHRLSQSGNRALSAFFAQNEGALALDLTHSSSALRGLSFADGTTEPEKANLLRQARGYQRAAALTDDVLDAALLVEKGFASAITVARKSPADFAEQTDLPIAVATKYHDKAKDIAAGVAAHVGTVFDLLDGGIGATVVGNVSADAGNFLKDLPGFADYFGSQDFCRCKHCQSIFGPAAYFVDLMTFIDERVTQVVYKDLPAHPLALKSRRPDLWTLELTCQNTNTVIPYLFIINEILENAVAQHAGFSGSFADRAAVTGKVYREVLPSQVGSFQQPFHLAFEEFATYLQHWSKSLADVAKGANLTGDALARLCLGLSPEEWNLMVDVNSNLPFLRRVYAAPSLTVSSGVVAPVDATQIRKGMGLSRAELGEIVESRFVKSAAPAIQIKATKRSPESIQNDVERLQGATPSALDRMHRFVRLLRKTRWRVGELDLVLSHLESAGLGNELRAPSAGGVAAIFRLQNGSGPLR